MKIDFCSRFNQYRSMWILVSFDLPTETITDRKRAGLFRKNLLKDGFQMFQFSIYVRFCASRENYEAHVKRIKSFLPPLGHVAIIPITDRQFGLIELFQSKKETKKPPLYKQLELF